MRVLVVHGTVQKKLIESVKCTLKNLNIENRFFGGIGDWRTSLLPLLEEYNHFLFIMTSSLMKKPGFYFAIGHCLGGNSGGFLFVNDRAVLPPYLQGFARGDKLSVLRIYLEKKQIDWAEEAVINQAKNSLEEAGIPVTNEGFAKCVSEGELIAVEMLLNAGFSANTRDDNGVPMLSIAIRGGHRSTGSFLLEAGADVNAISEDRGNNAIMDAAAGKQEEIVVDLINAGAEPDVKSKNGQTALVLAIGQGEIEIAKKLINAGANPGIADNLGMSARKYAKLFKHRELLDLIDNHSG